MSARLLVFSAFFFVTIVAASSQTTAGSRPKSCPVGTTFKKDCNTCTCGADASKDKCSKLDCGRVSGSSTTARTPTGIRPGTCPTKVTPAPGSKDCERRTTSTCSKDNDCGGAKKCCEDGCKRFICRNPIYNYTN